MKFPCPYCNTTITCQKEKHFPEYTEVGINCKECKGLVIITKDDTDFKYNTIRKWAKKTKLSEENVE